MQVCPAAWKSKNKTFYYLNFLVFHRFLYAIGYALERCLDAAKVKKKCKLDIAKSWWSIGSIIAENNPLTSCGHSHCSLSACFTSESIKYTQKYTLVS